MEKSGVTLFGRWREAALPGFPCTEITIAEPALSWAPETSAPRCTFLSALG